MQVMQRDIKVRVRAYIVDNFIMGGSADHLKDADSFMETHVVDSTGFLELVTFIEETYGFAVESDDQFSYLFANTNLLNFSREGGFANGPHSATKMYIGRVPRGQLDQQPEYWDGQGWSDDPAAAATISQRFWAENTMQPRYIDGRWVWVVKRDGFFGSEIVIDVAPHAWGPWVEAERIAYNPTPDEIAKNSYHPVIAPWSSEENGLIIIVSENAQAWDEAVERIDLYRPRAFRMDWPDPAPSGASETQEIGTPARAVTAGQQIGSQGR